MFWSKYFFPLEMLSFSQTPTTRFLPSRPTPRRPLGTYLVPQPLQPPPLGPIEPYGSLSAASTLFLLLSYPLSLSYSCARRSLPFPLCPLYSYPPARRQWHTRPTASSSSHEPVPSHLPPSSLRQRVIELEVGDEFVLPRARSFSSSSLLLVAVCRRASSPGGPCR